MRPPADPSLQHSVVSYLAKVSLPWSRPAPRVAARWRLAPSIAGPGVSFCPGGGGSRRFRVFTALAAFAAVTAAPACATVAWNPVSAFSVTSGNPNGVWSYGYMDTGFNTFTPFATTRTFGTNFLQWYGWAADFTPCVGANLDATTQNFVPPRSLLLHPGDGGQPAVARWTAPFGGTMRVTGNFHAGDGGVMQVAVRHNSTVQWSATDAGAFDFTVTVSAGDRIDFAVFGGYFYGSTGLQATITSGVVPVPLTTAETNKLNLGTYPAGTVLQIEASGTGEIAPGLWTTKPDGSLVSAAASPFTYNNSGATYASVSGFPSGDGFNRFPGGGSNYDYNGTGWVFAGKQTTDTTDPAAVRFGALVGTFAASPTRDDWFLIGYGGLFTVPAGGATFYVAVNESANASSNNTGAYALTHRVVMPATLALPLTIDAAGKIALGSYLGGTVVRLAVTGAGDLVDSRYQTYPDGSLAATAGAPYAFANANAAFPAVAGGDGFNHFTGGGSNYDHSGSGWGFAGSQTTDTTNAGAIRAGAVVGTFAANPARGDWFPIGRGGAFTVPGGGATLYLAVNDSFPSDNHGTYAVSHTVTPPALFSLPLATHAVNKLRLGSFAGGTHVRITAIGTGDLVDSRLRTNPDGSLAAAAGAPWTHAAANAAYPAVAGFPAGDGLNHFPGGGLNHDGFAWSFAGAQTTDTTDAAAIRMGALVGTFAANPSRADWFYLGYGRTVTIPAGGATLYVAVNESTSVTAGTDNHGSYALTAAVVSAPNDLFADAAVLTGTGATANATNADATKDNGEPSHAGNGGGSSLWWSWTAPKTGVVAVNTVGSSFDTLLGVYTGSAVGSLTTVASDDNSGPNGTSQLAFNATAGTTYRIAVDGASGASGSIVLNAGYAYQFTTLAGLAGASGSTDGAATAARFFGPNDVAVDGAGNLYIGENGNHTIRKITPGGAVSTLAGMAGAFGSADGTGSAARFKQPLGLAVDGSGNVLVADYENHTIRKIAAGGVVTTLAGLAGTSGSTEGTGGAARFNLPVGLAVDGSGNVFVADSANHSIRKIAPGGVVTTFAGLAGNSGSADGTGTAARFNNPYRLAIDGNGNLIVSDTFNHTIRKITPAGVVTTIAGAAGVAGVVDGAGGAARFNKPYGVAVDAGGTVFVADYLGHTVRKISPVGVVTTIAGVADTFGVLDGIGGAARFNSPVGVALDSSGNLFISDFNNQTIRRGAPAVAPTVNSISPAAVAAGSTVTLTGTGFAGAIGVTFNGVAAASFTVVSDTTITAVAPAIVTAGSIAVTGPGGTSTAAVSYTVAAPSPTANDRFDPGANGPVHAVVVQPDGRILIGGDFTSLQPFGAAAATTRTRLARLNRDGTIDPTFNAVANGVVYALALQADGKILVGGAFDAVNNQTRNSIARLDAGGALDPGFDPNANQDIFAIAVQPDGKILLGGYFTALQPNGTAVPVSRTLAARVNSDGKVDPAFNVALAGPDAHVHKFALTSDGAIYVAGYFTSVNAAARAHLVRLTPAGAVDPAFNPALNDGLDTLALQPDGKVLIGGNFSTVGGVAKRHFARLNPDGTLDAAFASDSDGTVLAIALQPDGRIVVGGQFGFVSAVSQPDLARFNRDGSRDATFAAAGDNPVHDLALQPDGSIVVVGAFATLGGHGRSRIARVLPDGSVERALIADTTGGVVGAIAVQPDGKIILGGHFTTVAGQTRNFVARLNADSTLDAFNPAPDASAIAPVVLPNGQFLVGGRFNTIAGQSRPGLARFNADGTFDAAFNAGLNGAVNSVLLQPDGKLVVGGAFTMVGILPRNRLVRLQADGSIDLTFNPDVNGEVFGLALQGDGAIVFGGNFTAVGGQLRNRIARVTAAGALDAFDPNASGPVNLIAVQADGKILVSGGFTSIAGETRSGVARLTTAGSIDAGFAPPAAVSGVYGVQADGRLLALGSFTAGDGVAPGVVARLNASGSIDPGFSPAVDGTAGGLSFALQPDGKTIVGGDFAHAGGHARVRLARLNATGPTAAALSATTAIVTLTRSGPLPELSWVTIEKSGDGVTGWTILGTATRVGTTAHWQLAGQNLPTNTTFYLRARGAAPTGAYGASSLVEHVQQVFLPSIPVVASIAPALAAPGTLVRLTGANLSGATGVTFNGTPASGFVVESATQLVVRVPAGATTGPVVVSTPGASSTASPVTLRLPTHRYTFSAEAVLDSAGTADGTLGNGATVTGGRLVLDGVDDHVAFATKLVPVTGPFTVAFFAQQASVQGGFREMISQGTTGASGFYVGHDTTRAVRVGDSWQATGRPFPGDGLMHHYAVVADAADARLYIDGVLVLSKGSPLSMTADGDNTRFGGQFSGFGEYFHGTLDEVWIFDRALSAPDVAVLAASATQTLTVRSDSATFAAATGDPVRLDSGNTTGLTFGPALVGAFGTGSPVPPGAPDGTVVINIPPGDGQSGFFKSTFHLPASFTAAKISGAANMDDAGRVYLNGQPLTPSLTSGASGVVTHSGNATFTSSDPFLFRPGLNELLVSDSNSGGGPSGGSFFATIEFDSISGLAPEIATQPANRTVAAGAAVSYSVAATGGTLAYQWHRGGAPIAGATGASHAIAAAQLADIGDYTVVVSNPFGSVTSRIATLHVTGLSAPTAVLALTGAPEYLSVGGTATFTARIDHQTQPTALGFTVNLPEGWSYVGGTGEPSVKPNPGATGVLEWGYSGGFGTGSSSFSFTVSYPASQTGDKVIGASAIYRTQADPNLVVPSITLARVPGQAPTIVVPPAAVVVNVGQAAGFAVEVGGTPPFTYQWSRNDTAIPGATAATLTLAAAGGADAGDYRVTITNAVGSVTVGPVRLTVITSDLVTLSVQSRLRAGGSTSSSFTIEGTQPKSILVRAAGPAVAPLFETAVNHLLDPRVRVYDRQLTEVGANNDWGTNATFAAANQAGVTPGFADGSKDAAVLLSLAPGTYTAVVDGNDGGGGLALLQIYDLEPARPRIVMLTARGQVGTGSDVLVAGFTLAGALPRKLLFRAPGEQLLDGFYLESGRILYDPMIYVYSSSNEQLAYNDDWSAENADIIAAAARVGAPPFNGYTLDTAILKELAPGNYSAQLVGYGGSVGESLIEIFEVDEQRAVASPPALTWVPSNQIGIAGHEAVFSVHAVGRPAVAYQWRRHGTNIVGATRQALRLENLQATDEKIDGVPVTYDVVVTNSEGSVASPARTLTLLPQYHAADSDRDGRIGLFELTRLIELYNFRSGGSRTGEYRSQAGSEDGFMPGPGTIASHHSADSNRDGRFDLSELTRAIELYNFTNDTVRTGEYHPEIGTEDGFALGPYFFNEGGDEVTVPPPR